MALVMSRQVIWAELRYGTVPSLIQKKNSQIPDRQCMASFHKKLEENEIQASQKNQMVDLNALN
jgi:hypothetical protein